MEADDIGGPIILIAACLGLVSLFNGFGTRRIERVYSFQYNGKSAVLNRQNIRWGPDKYFFSVDGKGKLTGTIPTDDGYSIKIHNSWRQDNARYSLLDSD